MAEQSLRDKTVKGVAWSAIDNVAGYAVTFIVGIILARILSPDDYGLIGLTGIFTAICMSFIDAGFSNALIRKKNATEEDYCTVFIINIGVSIILYLIIFFIAPFIALFFNREELTNLTRVSSLGLIISALALVQRTQLNKRIDFKTQAIITILTSFSSGFVGIVMAFTGFGVWALVIQGIVGSIVNTSLLWFFNKWIPQIIFSAKSFYELFGFSSKLLLSGLIDTIWGQFYTIIIGKCYAPAILGQYTRAVGFSSILSSNLTNIIQRVSYPVLSQIQDDKAYLRDAYRRMIRTSMLLTFSSMLMLVAIAKPLIIVLIGEKWMQAASFLQIICLGSMLYPLHAMNLNMLKVQGRSDLFLRLEILKKIIAVGPLMLGIFAGIYWMLIGSVFIGILSYYLNAYYSGPLLDYSIKHQILDITPSFLIALMSSLIAYLPLIAVNIMNLSINNCDYYFILPVQILLDGLSLFWLCEKFQLQEYYELKDIVKPFLAKKGFNFN